MTYETALQIIEAEFETRRESPYNKIIKTGLTYNGCNGFCVSIYNSPNGVIITDLGETKEIFDEVTQEEWTSLCQEHGFSFVHWSITRPFTQIEDVYEFIKFLDFLSDKFWDDED